MSLYTVKSSKTEHFLDVLMSPMPHWESDAATLPVEYMSKWKLAGVANLMTNIAPSLEGKNLSFVLFI